MPGHQPPASRARTLMIQGTASNVGKSLLVTALCRILHQDGWRVAPFKSQNMSNNSAITPDGREIGRAQGVQAEAAGIAATADMNPVLLKPCGDGESQVVIHGRPYATMDFRQYRQEGYALAAAAIRSSLQRLLAGHDAVLIEGAGSPAEVNLRDRELVNMRIATWAGAPVLLVADIDRGGALAALVGTLALLEPAERNRVAGLVINKFRGHRDLLQPAITFLEERTGKPVLGVIPYVDVDLDAEDSQVLDPPGQQRANAAGGGPGMPARPLRICALRLPRISNFTDLDSLRREPGVILDWVSTPAQLPGAAAVIIPGSKSTAADLRWVWQTGLGEAVCGLAARGVPVAGLCGGFQMLGRRVLDPHGHESALAAVPGLGLLDVETEFAPAAAKVTARTTARVLPAPGALAGQAGRLVAGYEIHMGRTELGSGARPLLTAAGPAESGGRPGGESGRARDAAVERDLARNVLGACDAGGQVWGTYLHGIFDNPDWRRDWLAWLWRRSGQQPPGAAGAVSGTGRAALLDRLAAQVRAAVDMDRIYALMELVKR